jgi:phosphate transport system substrate-binding protein
MNGSDTIGGDLAPALSAFYAKANPHVLVTVEALGSSSGFVGLLEGNAEIGASSRPIDAKELGEAEKRDVGLRESVIGYDGIAVIVHPDNPVRSLDMAQLAGVFGGGIANWQLVGGDDRPITLLSRPSYSGTHGLFLAKVLKTDKNPKADFAAHTTYIETSQELVSAVAGDPAAIGYVGVAWANEGVEVLAIAPARGETPLEPTPTTIGTGSYPIHRPLILYTREQLGRDSIDFMRFVLGERGQQIVAEHGFVPVGAQAEAGLPRLDDAVDVPAVHVTRLLFDAAATDLTEAHQATLAELAGHVAGTSARLAIVGNSETEGLLKGNERLATLRAGSVRDFLIAKGIADTRLEVRSAATEGVIENPERKAERRRVDVFVIE